MVISLYLFLSNCAAYWGFLKKSDLVNPVFHGRDGEFDSTLKRASQSPKVALQSLWIWNKDGCDCYHMFGHGTEPQGSFQVSF